MLLRIFIIFFLKYFPGKKEVKNYLNNLDSKLNSFDKNELDSTEWEQMTNEYKSDSFLTNNTEWTHCKGSDPNYRGYPCSLWTLFHTLTLSQIDYENSKTKPCNLPSLFF